MTNILTWIGNKARKALEILSLGTESATGYDWFTSEEVAYVYNAVSSPDAGHVDDTTWQDLQLDSYARIVAEDASIGARQIIFNRLKTGDQLANIGAMLGAPAELLAAQVGKEVFSRLRRHKTVLAKPIFDESYWELPNWAPKIWGVSCLSIFGMFSALLGYWTAATCSFALYACLAVPVAIKLARMPGQLREIERCLAETIGTGLAVGNDDRCKGTAVASAVIGRLEDIKEVRRLTKRSPFELIPGLLQYLNLFFLVDYARIHPRVARLTKHRAKIAEIFLAICEVEANSHVLLHASQFNACPNVHSGPHSINLHSVVNPLVKVPVPVSVTFDSGGCIITGKNGVGKSTLLRAIGINLIVARAYGFCYAGRASVSSYSVYASIEHADSLLLSESLFMAELRRMERICEISGKRRDVLVLIDELFKGTNPVESVAAAASVLRYLSGTNTVLATTHQLMIIPLLEGCTAPMRLVRSPANDRLLLEPGVQADTNGIELMATYRFPTQVKEDAMRLACQVAEYSAHAG